MRLLLTTDTVGGVWEYSVTLARAIEREGHALLVAVVGDPSDEQIAMLPEGIAIECRDYPLEWAPTSVSHLTTTAEWLAGLTRAWRTDVVHLNQMAYTALASFGRPTVVVVHSDVVSWFAEVRGTPAPPEWSGYIEVVRAGLARAALTVAPSMAQARSTARHYGCRIPRVIHNGVEVPRDLPADREDPLLLTSGRAWDSAKGHAVLDRALSFLPTPVPAHLIGATEGPGGEQFAADHLICHGRVPAGSVVDWMRCATIYIAPSLYEPFGLAPVEAAMNGCALLLSDIPTFHELWDGAAVFVPKGDARALASAIEVLLSDEEGTRRLARRGHERAVRAFGADRFASDYLSLYAGLARGETPPPPTLVTGVI